MEMHRSDSEYSEPEPDVAVLAAASNEYRSRHPRGDEAILVAEVADSSVRQDSTVKRDLYARAGVPEYWALDITGNRLIAHRKPSNGQYTEIVSLSQEESVPVPSRSGKVIALAKLFA